VAEAAQPTEEELRAKLEEQLREIKIGELLLQTVYTVTSLAYQRLSAGDRNLEEARLGIEAIGALLPVLDGTIPADATRDFNQVLANLKLAYAAAAAEKPADDPPPPDAAG
jgi:hypothetical protein